ncbi:MAG: glutathione S-transferase N-terminal domain-containing protein, partial [Nevskiales bacterium]
MSLPVLYSFRRCPYAMRARIALAKAGVTVELREILLKDKPAEMLALSPKGTVPVLQLPGGEVIDESLDVMRWALQGHDPDSWLEPDPELTEVLIEANDGPFKSALDRYKYFTRFPEQPREVYRAQGETFFA